MRRIVGVFLATGMFAAAVPAMAQGATLAPPPPLRDAFRDRPTGRSLMENAPYEMMTRNPGRARFFHGNAIATAKCIAGLSGDRAGRLLVDPDKPDYSNWAVMMRTRYHNCAPTEVEVPGAALNAALAEVLVLRGKGNGLPARVENPDQARAKAFYGSVEGPPTADKVVRCMTFHAPGTAYKVLQTGFGSKEEAAAVDALHAATPECGLTTRPASLPAEYERGVIAESLYRLANVK